MRKITLLLFTIILSVSLLFGATACGEDKKYDVNFIVDGDVYKTIGTDGDEEISLPKNPTLGNHEFEGWFIDNGTFLVKFTTTYLLDNPITKDLNVYAKFKDMHVHHYEITYVPKTCTSGGHKEFKCLCGHEYIGEQQLPLGHALSLYQTVLEPTCITEGEEKAVCLRQGCTHSVTRKIPASQYKHQYGEDNKCTICGETKNN
jgi:hypothetical protein